MPEYLISQHDPRGERADQLAAVRREYRYTMDFGFPVSSTLGVEHEPVAAWQLKALAKQEDVRLNLLRLKRHGKWNFVNDLQPLAPHKLAAMVREGDMGGIVEYFMPLPGGVTGDHHDKTIKAFQTSSPGRNSRRRPRTSSPTSTSRRWWSPARTRPAWSGWTACRGSSR